MVLFIMILACILSLISYAYDFGGVGTSVALDLCLFFFAYFVFYAYFDFEVYCMCFASKCSRARGEAIPKVVFFAVSGPSCCY